MRVEAWRSPLDACAPGGGQAGVGLPPPGPLLLFSSQFFCF